MFEANGITTMGEMFSHMGDVEFPILERGGAETIGEFYQTIVLPNELDEDIVRGWWDLLKKYCNPNDNKHFIAFVRRYGNCRKDRKLQRRGFFSRYHDGSGYVFCDNSLADYFYTMAKARFVPDYEDFKNYILNRKFPCCVRGVREEYEADDKGNPLYQAYRYQPASKPRGLYCHWQTADGRQRENKMWYLAHMLDVDNPRDYPIEYKENSGRIFSQGKDRSDWCLHDGVDFPYRDMGGGLCDDDRKLITAHFIRLVCPMNYFLTPQNCVGRRRFQRLEVKERMFKRGIQELPEMKMFVREKRLERYGEIFKQYEELAMATNRQVNPEMDLGAMVINLKYCPPNEELD